MKLVPRCSPYSRPFVVSRTSTPGLELRTRGAKATTANQQDRIILTVGQQEEKLIMWQRSRSIIASFFAQEFHHFTKDYSSLVSYFETILYLLAMTIINFYYQELLLFVQTAVISSSFYEVLLPVDHFCPNIIQQDRCGERSTDCHRWRNVKTLPLHDFAQNGFWKLQHCWMFQPG